MNTSTEQVFLLNSVQSSAAQKSSDAPSRSQVNLENVEDMSNVCRVCASVTEFIMPIFEGEGLQNNLEEKIHKHLPIKVSAGDSLPQVVCYQCASTLLAWHELAQCALHADAALHARARARARPQETTTTPQEATQNVEEDKSGVRPTAPPVYGDGEPARRCEYCHTTRPERDHGDHLVARHRDLIFHCDECSSYVDKKEFLLHMSLHIVRYAHRHQNPTRPKKLKKPKLEPRVEGAAAAAEAVPRTGSSDPRGDGRPQAKREANANGTRSTRENEFSDHSDAESGFGPLPTSVFDAIEDTRDDSPPGDDRALRNENSPTSPSKTTNKKSKTKKSRKCPFCAKTYTASSSYFYHLKHVHKDGKEHECDVCGRKFSTKAGLNQHSPIHTGVFDYECKSCGKRFRSKASLYIHEQTHTGIKTLACSHCDQSFRWKTHLLRHIKRHTAEKAHACPTCGRGFNIRCDLMRHMRTHAAGNFECEKCGQKFAQQRYLKVHIDNKHSAK